MIWLNRAYLHQRNIPQRIRGAIDARLEIDLVDLDESWPVLPNGYRRADFYIITAGLNARDENQAAQMGAIMPTVLDAQSEWFGKQVWSRAVGDGRDVYLYQPPRMGKR